MDGDWVSGEWMHVIRTTGSLTSFCASASAAPACASGQRGHVTPPPVSSLC